MDTGIIVVSERGEAAMSTATVAVEITGMPGTSWGSLVDDCLQDVESVPTAPASIRSGQCVAAVADSVSDVRAAVVASAVTGTIPGTAGAS
jgi:hypothetical protein